jgi:hypothetical protein
MKIFDIKENNFWIYNKIIYLLEQDFPFHFYL